MLLLLLFVVQFLIILYLAIPFVISKFPRYYQSFVFKPRDDWGNREEHFTCFDKLRLSDESVRNLYVTTEDTQDRLGVWHIRPYENVCDLQCTTPTEESVITGKESGRLIFIYFHGNTKTRAVPWRIDIYKLLSSLGYDVITFDYRGYGDSSGKMTGESDCVYDSVAVLRFIQNEFGSAPVFFWGHSLGTGVVGSVVRYLLTQQQLGVSAPCLPRGIILDAPFTNLANVMISRKSMWPYRVVPLMKKKLTTLTSNMRVEFNTERNLSDCPVPVLILHAKDDQLVPFKLGKQLAKSLEESVNVRFVSFEAERGYRHNFIHKAPEIPHIVQTFVQSVLNRPHSIDPHAS